MIAGVDACPGGWIAACCEGFHTHPVPNFILRPSFAELMLELEDCRAVAVDMPIGLPAGAELRRCDLEAKKLLGSKAQARVFPAPPRSLLAAETPEDFQAGHKALLGKGAPVPLWRIMPKIREVDTLMSPDLQQRVVEAHPELAFMHLAGEALPSKHKPEGLAARVGLLQQFVSGIADLGDCRDLRPAKADDVLDAVVLLFAAAHVAGLSDVQKENGRRLPEGAIPVDARGLRMEMWF
jgi:predicted RNase H-like nuclease